MAPARRAPRGNGSAPRSLRGRGRLRRDDARAATIFAEALVDDGAVDQGKEGEVAAHADVGAGMDAGAALADEDVAGAHGLAGEDLDAASLALAVAAVAGAALTFLVRHRKLLARRSPSRAPT